MPGPPVTLRSKCTSIRHYDEDIVLRDRATGAIIAVVTVTPQPRNPNRSDIRVRAGDHVQIEREPHSADPK